MRVDTTDNRTSMGQDHAGQVGEEKEDCSPVLYSSQVRQGQDLSKGPEEKKNHGSWRMC